jgi:DNA-binding LacI/PurR family transcriptional regulator
MRPDIQLAFSLVCDKKFDSRDRICYNSNDVRSIVRSIVRVERLVPMPSVRQIANLAGVSTSTVSLVLNGKPGVSEAMRVRVQEALQALQKQEIDEPSLVSANDRKSNLSVVVIHPGILRSSQVFGELLHGIEAGAAIHNLQLRLVVNEGDVPNDHVYQLYFSDPKLFPDGVLVIGDRADKPLPAQIQELSIPTVLVGRESTNFKFSAVGRDEKQIAYDATRFLLDLGHRSIAFVGGELPFRYTHSRLEGYKLALSERLGEIQERWIALGSGDKASRQILEKDPEISAVIFINDAYAEEGLPIFQAAGRTIPDDLSVISFDDTQFARSFDPPLTSIAYPRYDEGLHAVRVLVEKIKNPDMKFCQIIFNATLVKRASCKPPKST